MADLKTRVQGMDPNLGAKAIELLASENGNLYEALSVISIRARQLNQDLKMELHQKLEEFATHTDTIEEIHENKEQIEISKFYERLPNAAIIATQEFLDDELEYSYRNNVDKEEFKD